MRQFRRRSARWLQRSRASGTGRPVIIMAARQAVSSRKVAAHSQVARWKKRCRPGWRIAGSRSATISAASRATSGSGPRAVRANRTHRQRFPSGIWSRRIHSSPVARSTAVCSVSATAEIVMRLGTHPVAALRRATVAQVAASPAISPASRPASQAASAHAAAGSPADSVRLHPMVASSRSGRGSSRCPGMREPDISCGSGIVSGVSTAWSAWPGRTAGFAWFARTGW